MATILFSDIVFGPIKSRRLGTSLGINLLPKDGKLCSFDCAYCECGLNKDFIPKTKIPTRTEAIEAIETKLSIMSQNNEPLDVITFAGNGEPTLHPEFEEIIEDTILIRNKYYPNCAISVLSNGMHLNKKSVVRALKKIENNILKLDSGILETALLINKPNSPAYNLENQVEMFKQFNGNFILQTMFLKGKIDGKDIDNTTEEEIEAWLKIVKELNPREVMIYTIDRETPVKTLKKISFDKLNEIGDKVKQLGIKINVAG